MTSEELLSSAETYFASHPESSYWSALSSTQKASSLTLASVDVLAELGADIELDRIDAGTYACYAILEQALNLSHNYSSQSFDGRRVASESADGISVSYAVDSSTSDISVAILSARARMYLKKAKRQLFGGSPVLTRG